VQFQRRQTPPTKKHHRAYKLYLRQDFLHRCAYCLIHEAHYGGLRNFHVDHFRPKGLPKFRHLALVYTNLYYACALCNTNKGNTWPTDELLNLGFRFLDPCEEDPFEGHLEINKQDGSLLVQTPAGEYTVYHLRLNRNQLKKHRCRLFEAQRMCEAARGLLASADLPAAQRRQIETVIEELEKDYRNPLPPYESGDLRR
jgi:hypothetical protein